MNNKVHLIEFDGNLYPAEDIFRLLDEGVKNGVAKITGHIWDEELEKSMPRYEIIDKEKFKEFYLSKIKNQT